jgi:predicted site-specific integrase-resolvase
MPPTKSNNIEYEKYLDEIVSLAEAAQIRKISVWTLRSEIRKGRLRAIRLSEKKLGMSRREAMTSLRGI